MKKVIIANLIICYLSAQELKFPSKKELRICNVPESKIAVIFKKEKSLSVQKNLKAYLNVLDSSIKSPETDISKINSLIQRIANLKQRELKIRYSKWLKIKQMLSKTELKKLLIIQSKKTTN